MTLQPGVLSKETGGQLRYDITSSLSTHPDFDPDFEDYPDEGPGHRVRYAELPEEASDSITAIVCTLLEPEGKRHYGGED